MRNKKFVPRRYINNQIKQCNCNHELLITSCFVEEDNNKYRCLICDSEVVYEKDDIKNKYVYYDLYDGISVSFLKNLLNYISLKSIKSRGLNIAKLFKELEPSFEKIDLDLNEKLKATDTQVVGKRKFRTRKNSV